MFITGWAVVEAALPMQVARLIAARRYEGPHVFDQVAFLRSGVALLGTSASAALNQIENLAPSRKDEIRQAAEKIRDIKKKRDIVVHSPASPTVTDITLFLGLGASRVGMGTNKPYSVGDLKRWCNELKSAARKIDAIVTDLTGWRWKRIEEDQQRFSQAIDEMEQKTRGRRSPSDTDSPTND